MKKRSLTVLILVISIFLISDISYADNFFDKLLRGIINTATGWVEIPKQVIKTSQEESFFKGLTVGLAKGIGRGVTRTAVGLCETTTFIAPFPKEGYKPIMTPESVFQKEEKKEKEKEEEEVKEK